MKVRRKPGDSAALKCEAGILSYHAEAWNWSLPVSDLRLIGEYTTSDGPFADDYFLVFFVSQDDRGRYASFYAEGREEALSGCEEIIGATLRLELCNSAEFKTRIIWPVELIGKPLFDRVPPATTWQKIRQDWLGASTDLILSDAAKSVFEDRKDRSHQRSG